MNPNKGKKKNTIIMQHQGCVCKRVNSIILYMINDTKKIADEVWGL